MEHHDAVQAYLKKQETLWETLRAAAEEQSSPVVKRLRALKAADVSNAS